MGGGSLTYQSSYNVGIGPNSLSSITTGYSNTALGSRSLLSNTIGYDNTAIGYCPLYTNISGTYNVAVGNYSLFQNTTGFSNSAAGYKSLSSNTTGNWCSAYGAESLISNISGNNNSAFGYQSLYYNNGNGNSAFGSGTLVSNNSGSNNSAFGFQALYSNTADSNSAFGYRALFSNSTGIGNNAFGSEALYSNTTGSFNLGFGDKSLQSNVTGNFNSAFGFETLKMNHSHKNTAFGYRALTSFTDPGYGDTGSNSAFGFFALYQCTTGSQNTAVGSAAGSTVTSGINLTLIGYGAQPSSGSATDEITLGNNLVSKLRCNVQGITGLSDARDKKNIKDLSLGLDFLMKVKPREFNWDRRDWYESGNSDGSKMQKHPTAGFIAQEFDSLQTTEHAEWLNLVLKSNPDKLEATYSNLLPVVVKAIQELKSENDQLKSEVESLKSVKEQLAEIESLKQELTDQINILKAKSESTIVKFSSIGD